MTSPERIDAFVSLGDHLRGLSSSERDKIVMAAQNENPWFTAESVIRGIDSIASWLHREKLHAWVNEYPETDSQKCVAIVMAGNIPLVGFHDLLAVLLSGHTAMIKLSSKDQQLPRYLIDNLLRIDDRFSTHITIVDRLKDFDAVIATGSDNSARYFQFYFAKYPHIIRKNRTSVAVLTGTESSEDLEKLGADVFAYYGLGCRNVSKLFVPSSYDFGIIFRQWEKYAPIQHHHKYVNNYDYQKSILLINRQPFLDNGFVLLQQNKRLVSPISVVYYDYYADVEALSNELKEHAEKIQVIVGDHVLASVPFGQTQCPGLSDYPDNVDIMKFLTSL